MPDHYATVMRRFVEDLVVPETHWSIEQLCGRDNKSRVPQQIVQSRRDAPRAERMKKYLLRVGGCVCIELVEQAVTGMLRIYQLL